MILVDYACPRCGGRQERWAPSPPPEHASCAACGASARRAWAPIGLSADSRADTRDSPPAPAARAAPLCARYPQVPGLCHMSPSAGRLWTARYLKDNRRVDAELARQEARAAVRPPTLADAITHHHHNVAVPSPD